MITIETSEENDEILGDSPNLFIITGSIPPADPFISLSATLIVSTRRFPHALYTLDETRQGICSSQPLLSDST
jgi:hypothetical protein